MPSKPPNWVDRFRPLMRWSNRWEALQIRLLGRSAMTLLRPGGVLVIETRGRSTGRLRRTPLAYLPDDATGFYVGGGAAGMTAAADWVSNLRADPRATVVVRRQRIEVVAEELVGDVRDAVDRQARQIWPGVARYATMSGRPVPYFRLLRRARPTGPR